MALAALGLLAGAAIGQVAVISGQSIDQYGQPLPFASVRVCSATSTTDSSGNCTPTANIFLDFGLTIPAGNPYTSDQYGNYTVYAGALAAPNLYTVQLFPASGITWSYVVNGPFCSVAGCTFIGPVTGTTFNATTSPYYEVNGVQLASTNLLDTGNIAYKNAANTFSASPQTAPVWNATTQFNVSGVQIACTNLSDCANLAKINASNTFTGTTQTAPIFNVTTKFQLGGGGPANHVLLGSGTGYVDSATIPYSIISGTPPAPFAATGIPFATSTTTSTVATSAQIVTALNTSPSSTFAPALLPLATTAAFGAGKCDGTTIACTSGVLSVIGGVPAARVCNSNGCYVTYSDGTILQWGAVTGCATSDNASCTEAVTFPTNFTTTTNLTITPSVLESSTSQCFGSFSSPGTSGFTFAYSSVVYVGGGGNHCPGTQTGEWVAVGH